MVTPGLTGPPPPTGLTPNPFLGLTPSLTNAAVAALATVTNVTANELGLGGAGGDEESRKQRQQLLMGGGCQIFRRNRSL